ncbi:MAG: Holliday junction branch migration protein RuvA [Candidatus Omnitrophota bacterium]|nr:Holliday junction branch migration protein RuvA [Candidatus Omnitrophota bacterium]
MINYLDGKLIDKHPTRIVIDVGGMGYNVNIPLSTFDKLGVVDSRVKIFTYLHVRKDSQQLYGFITMEEKNLFGLLLLVSGVGPKLALTILSGASVKEVKSAIANKAVRVLNSIPRLGKKISERIIVDLREKVSAAPVLKSETAGELSSKQESIFNDAVLALISLGYKQSTATQAVRRVISHVQEDMTSEQLIRRALRFTQR